MPKQKILICDDEEGIRDSIKLILSEEPYSLSFAVNAKEALSKAGSFKPDLVILDIKMPELSGLEAIEQIKSNLPGVKIIMLSGYIQPEVIKEALSKGADDYLVKSFTSEQLKKIINKALNRA